MNTAAILRLQHEEDGGSDQDAEHSTELGVHTRCDQAAARSTGSAADAVADVGGLWCVDHPNDLQLDARPQHLEQPTTATEQHWDLVDLQLVQHAGSSACCAVCAPCTATLRSAVAAFACAMAPAIPSLT